MHANMPTYSFSSPHLNSFLILQELQQSLKKGTSLDELWKVANGQIKYSDFLSNLPEGQADNKTSNEQPQKIPDELVRVLIYVYPPTLLS